MQREFQRSDLSDKSVVFAAIADADGVAVATAPIEGGLMESGTELAELLATTATNSERVRGLLALGLPPNVVAATTRSTVGTVRNWAAGETQPRHEADVVLDDLRTTAKALLDNGLEAERIGRWLLSRDPARFGGMRPIERIVYDPMEVLAEAHGEALEAAGSGPQAVVPLRPA